MKFKTDQIRLGFKNCFGFGRKNGRNYIQFFDLNNHYTAYGLSQMEVNFNWMIYVRIKNSLWNYQHDIF